MEDIILAIVVSRHSIEWMDLGFDFNGFGTFASKRRNNGDIIKSNIQAGSNGTGSDKGSILRPEDRISINTVGHEQRGKTGSWLICILLASGWN